VGVCPLSFTNWLLAAEANHLCCPADTKGLIRGRSQLFIRTNNETLSVLAVRINNPDRSPVGIKS
jgi:hypothetical protein